MGKYSKEDIIRLVKEEDIQFIRMQFTDIFGQMKNVAITASQVERAVNNQTSAERQTAWQMPGTDSPWKDVVGESRAPVGAKSTRRHFPARRPGST